MHTRIGLQLFTVHHKLGTLRISDKERQNSPLIQNLLGELSVSALVVDLGNASAVANIPHIEHLMRQGIKVGTAPPSIHENMHLLNTYNPARIIMITNTSEGVREALTMGCWAIAVTKTEESETEQQRKAAAHYKVTSLNDLPNVIADINSQLRAAVLPHASLPQYVNKSLAPLPVNEETPLISFPT